MSGRCLDPSVANRGEIETIAGTTRPEQGQPAAAYGRAATHPMREMTFTNAAAERAAA